MPSQSAIQKMNKMLGAGSVSGLGRKFSRDSDRDGVPNIMDCRPYNPRKQGIIHDIKSKIESARQESKERAVEASVRREMAHQAGGEEREKQAMETAIYREKMMGEKERERIKSGGFLGAVTRFATAPPKRAAARPRAVSKKKPKTIKRKFKRRIKRRAARASPQSLYFDVSKFKY